MKPQEIVHDRAPGNDRRIQGIYPRVRTDQGFQKYNIVLASPVIATSTSYNVPFYFRCFQLNRAIKGQQIIA